MKIFKVKDYEEMSKMAADIIEEQIKEKPDSVLGLATGSTPEGMYAELTKKYEIGKVDFSKVKTVNLDEYKGLDKNNSQSYYNYMYNNLFKKININLENVHLPDGTAPDSESECENYDKIICSLGGVDLQVLGMGPNGHIGFNEPNDYFKKRTHCISLSQSTIDANSRFFKNADEVPKSAYTMGIGSIMNAKKILLLVSGSGKAKMLKEALQGVITPQIPASILQFHNSVVVIADEEASKEL